MSFYKRAVLTGTLTTCTNLHIGSGEYRPSTVLETGYSELALDAQQQPYIPASSLRGFLRSRVEDSSICKTLFGLGRQPAESEEGGNSGHVRLYDALIKYSIHATKMISRTSINPITAAAKEHHLSTYQVIEPGAEFSVNIELDNINKKEIESLLLALSELNNDVDGLLGKGRSIGQGKLKWELAEVKVLTQAKLKEWLKTTQKQDSQRKKSRAKYKKTDQVDMIEGDAKALHRYFEPEAFALRDAISTWKPIEVFLKVNSPILINDPHRIRARKALLDSLLNKLEVANSPQSFDELKKRIADLTLILDRYYDPDSLRRIRDSLVEFNSRCDTLGGRHDTDSIKALFEAIIARLKNLTIPDALYTRYQRRACIPASTSKGWVRAQCRKILLTLQDPKDNNSVDNLLAPIFGSTEQGLGCLRFKDALADVSEEKQLHSQTFNAVDRFTGGVKPHALFHVEAIWPDAFRGTIYYQSKKMEGWMRILLLYALRDAQEGDMVLGWGKSKGFGQLRLEQAQIDLCAFDDVTLEQWHQSLLEQLKPQQEAT